MVNVRHFSYQKHKQNIVVVSLQDLEAHKTVQLFLLLPHTYNFNLVPSNTPPPNPNQPTRSNQNRAFPKPSIIGLPTVVLNKFDPFSLIITLRLRRKEKKTMEEKINHGAR